MSSSDPRISFNNARPSAAVVGGTNTISVEAWGTRVSRAFADSDKHAMAGRGQMRFWTLDEHWCAFVHTINLAPSHLVARDTGELLPGQLRRFVAQWRSSGDPKDPHNPRLGIMSLNLSKYGDKRSGHAQVHPPREKDQRPAQGGRTNSGLGAY
jgi:hypothetical protein